jgi:hypothetical protein
MIDITPQSGEDGIPAGFLPSDRGQLPDGRFYYSRISPDTQSRISILQSAPWQALFDEANLLPAFNAQVPTIIATFGRSCP